MGEYQLNIGEYLMGLDGDVVVYSVQTRMARDREYTVVVWAHDGIDCVDIYPTENGVLSIDTSGCNYPDEADDIFMTVYVSTTACMRLEGDLPESIASAFVDAALAEW